MTNEAFSNLAPGDLIKHQNSVETLVVTQNYGDNVTAVRTDQITNGTQWDVISKHHFKLITKES